MAWLKNVSVDVADQLSVWGSVINARHPKTPAEERLPSVDMTTNGSG